MSLPLTRLAACITQSSGNYIADEDSYTTSLGWVLTYFSMEHSDLGSIIDADIKYLGGTEHA